MSVSVGVRQYDRDFRCGESGGKCLVVVPARVGEPDVVGNHHRPGFLQVFECLGVVAAGQRVLLQGLDAAVIDADDHYSLSRVVLGRKTVLRMDRQVDQTAGLSGVAGELLGVQEVHDAGQDQRDHDRDGGAIRVPVADVPGQGRRDHKADDCRLWHRRLGR